MDIAGLINRVGSLRREFAGAFYMTALPLRGNGFDASIELLRSDDAVYFEGGLVRPGYPAPVAFKFTIPFAGLFALGGKAELSCPLIGHVAGEVLTCGNGFAFLGASGGTACSLHLWFTSQQSFSLAGMVQTPLTTLAFSAAPSSQWEESAQAKIYSLRPRA